MRLLIIIAAAVAALASAPAYSAACAGFTDVDSANTYCPAVTYLKDKGITLGCTGTMYCPNDYVTRLQMALFLQRAGRGGPNNTLGSSTTTIGGGDHNTVTHDFDTVGGGYSNVADGYYGVVSGGYGNHASGPESTVGGGYNNYATGQFSTVLGGQSNVASGNASIAGGTSANANYNGCMVFADSSSSSQVSCGANNEFIVRGLGGIFLLTGGSSDVTYTGTYVAPGSGSWTNYSDRDGKDDVTPVDPLAILSRVVAMPMATWHYKAQDSTIRHIGPIAQDFFAAFSLGETDKGISTVDGQGVALAAIQGLNAKLESETRDKDVRIAELQREISEVRALIAATAH